eukprot:Platyproteum_vivax@DN14582_c0_g1_i1.p1
MLDKRIYSIRDKTKEQASLVLLQKEKRTVPMDIVDEEFTAGKKRRLDQESELETGCELAQIRFQNLEAQAISEIESYVQAEPKTQKELDDSMESFISEMETNRQDLHASSSALQSTLLDKQKKSLSAVLKQWKREGHTNPQIKISDSLVAAMEKLNLAITEPNGTKFVEYVGEFQVLYKELKKQKAAHFLEKTSSVVGAVTSIIYESSRGINASQEDWEKAEKDLVNLAWEKKMEEDAIHPISKFQK